MLRVDPHYDPHRWQRRGHDSDARNVLLIAGRRGGKSAWLSQEVLKRATQGPVGVSLITGPDLPTIKQSVLEIMLGTDKGHWPRALIKDHNRSDRMLTLVDGNRILYRGGDDPDDLRGIKAKCVGIEEITLCDPEILPVIEACTLDTKGLIRAVGTPKGRNWLWTLLFGEREAAEVVPNRVWRSGLWEVIRYPSTDNPAIDPLELERIGQDYDDRMRRQEFEAEFVSWAGAAFDEEVLARCFAMPDTHWCVAHADHPTQIGVDPAGHGADWTAAHVVCWRCRTIVGAYRSRRPPFAVLYRDIGRLAAQWKPRTVVYDYTALGGQAIGDEFAVVIAAASPTTHCEPFVFTRNDKAELLMSLAARLEDGIGIPLRPELQPLRHQLRAYEWDDKALVTDDVMALAMAVKGLPRKDTLRGSTPQAAGLAKREYHPVNWEHERKLF